MPTDSTEKELKLQEKKEEESQDKTEKGAVKVRHGKYNYNDVHV